MTVFGKVLGTEGELREGENVVRWVLGLVDEGWICVLVWGVGVKEG